MTIRTITGSVEAGNGRFALVVSRWNSFVVEQLQQGAIETLRRHGVSDRDMTIIQVPGAFEIPLACRKAAASGDYHAIIALGAVIRGETAHFEYVAGPCVTGLRQVMSEYGLPVAFGVLTTDTLEQAVERCGGKGDNKGEEAALTALEMVSLLSQL
ncbi:MAG: 6,7-dimethyl-8-ribityllumazine synthase [Halieaceae bacterium]|nr:6,7-dimethyl-8-ribityllumazine synthase [Halieaceae bacterium]